MIALLLAYRTLSALNSCWAYPSQLELVTASKPWSSVSKQSNFYDASSTIQLPWMSLPEEQQTHRKTIGLLAQEPISPPLPPPNNGVALQYQIRLVTLDNGWGGPNISPCQPWFALSKHEHCPVRSMPWPAGLHVASWLWRIPILRPFKTGELNYRNRWQLSAWSPLGLKTSVVCVLVYRASTHAVTC